MNQLPTIAVIQGRKTTSFFCVDWAYPTSPNAVKFKTPNGSWCVSVTYSTGPDTVKTETKAGGFDSREKAQAWADVNLVGMRQLKAPEVFA